ncbi:DUF418 domain-containing protein [Actinomadura kijaniata]|uniref:DUF418 domain-containing protein n=1 Tax=Actinomadura kijaniata TaxID=46161 RepID=UPI003F194626
MDQTTDGPRGPETARVARGGVQARERALAPDLARGLMLLLIVLSNTAFHLYAAEHGPSGWHPVDGSALDRAVRLVMIVTLDMRVYPLFGFLFGYGMMQLFLRQTAAGTSERRAARLLYRRGFWLVVIGLLHSTLLMAGDIVGAYGVASLLLVLLFLRRAPRTQLVWAGIAAAVTVLLYAGPLWALARGDVGAFGPAAGDPPSTRDYASGTESYLDAMGTRATTGFFVTFVGGPLMLTAPQMVLAFWAARRRVLEEPHRHLRLLRRTAVVAVPAGWLGALPMALAHSGIWHVPPAALSAEGTLAALRDVTGTLGGVGYVAVFALLAHHLSERARRHPVTVAVTAVGKRSLSTYLTHSLIFAPVLAAWGLGLGAHLNSATMALFATGVWLVTVAAAHALERADRRGPAEAVLRRLTYGTADHRG